MKSKSLTTIKARPVTDDTVIQSYRDIPESEWIEIEHPGVALLEDFMQPYGITAYKLARATKLSQSHISEIISGKRTVTIETSYRLGKALGVSARFFCNLQMSYDEMQTVRRHAKDPLEIARLIPLSANCESVAA